MELNSYKIACSLRLEDFAWQILRLHPDVQFEVIEFLLRNTDSWSMIQRVSDRSREMLEDGGMTR